MGTSGENPAQVQFHAQYMTAQSPAAGLYNYCPQPAAVPQGRRSATLVWDGVPESGDCEDFCLTPETAI